MKLRAGEITFWQQCVVAALQTKRSDNSNCLPSQAANAADLCVLQLRDRLQPEGAVYTPYRDPTPESVKRAIGETK